MTLTSDDYSICIVAIEELISTMEEGIKSAERLTRTTDTESFHETISLLLGLKIRLLNEKMKL